MIRNESENEVSTDSESSLCDYNELHDVFCELYKEAKKLKKLNKSLRNRIIDLEKMNTDLKNDFEKVKNENDDLRKPCLNCVELVDALRKKNFRNQFISKQTHMHGVNSCSYCMRLRHRYYNCMIRKRSIPSGQYIWIKKDVHVKTNSLGPKRVWVPKLD
ncbi:hypothetical protein Fmac_014353 [Flemingia macrophylla]|uniref:Uncharacterized protein n=1 Tax=Flemingia macrophylla TaxID=520843 RepID=A0ABD1MDH6_9FABA